jgi:hypothetical protein
MLGGFTCWFSWTILATQWFLLSPPTCLIQVGSPSVGYIWFHILQFLGALVIFDDVDPVLDLDPEIDIEQEVVFDHELPYSGALTYLVDHVMTSNRLALMSILLRMEL